MKQVGIIKEIWRYPVKGMAGEMTNSCPIGPDGLAGDRVWALRDTARQEIQSCKFRPNLLQCTATSRNQTSSDNVIQHVDIRFPLGDSLGSDDISIHQKLSELVGHESTLEKLQPLTNKDFYRRYKKSERGWLAELKDTFEREPGEPLPDFSDFPQQSIDYVTVPGTFFLVSSIHIITTSTLQHLHEIQPEADWDIRRFRPNIVIETDNNQGLIEQEWVGQQLTFANHVSDNSSTTIIDCVDTAPRCGAVTRQQDNISSDKSMLKTIVKHADQNLGIYGNTSNHGILNVGDPVYLA